VYGLLIALHVFICAALIISVLLQSAKGEGLAGAFGGTSLTGTVFGGRGAATFLSRATSVLAVAFMASCIVIALVRPSTSSNAVTGGSSAVEQAARKGQANPVEQPGGEGHSGTQTMPGETPSGQTPAGQPAAGQKQPPTGPGEDLFKQAPQTNPTNQSATPATKPDSGKK
jgi:preprotein translocase subunit SecG